ncbi:hypothetical protein M2459_000641 [Parabacteroides sp. PF5-5]|uniref:hypothetical protein n=1 Tax=unclassified Parabacteroides TaxID=2649774 RepID=UPI0024763423|nr:MULTISPECIES: hypothetical protein [unclassified Parabacteroides]MDH6303425.1 hypothetical protein [Parabacteroides sp. PH5-39]MDH6314748.1 hypothetical protein [Parabacteroides sp. PF5-13]MDH6318085.1 hypothetical protein [Parabacteroides sp. PH5-13]MDH6321984.1 hypothetical protein [Parabacteroides sp. PH5-8]MDH6326107.1 hypothetical protein [Parabacteroides sp. PH5-41]
MKQKLILIPLMTTCLLLSLHAGNYRSFKVSVYTRAYEVEKMKDLHWLDSTWNIISQQIKVDKIYLETHRDLLIVPSETLEQAKKFFHDRGIETGGGITYTINEANSFETFCYSNPEHRKLVQEIAEHTAKHFDDYILDDFFFTSCKSDIEIKAKGTQSWTDYRLKLMTEAGQNLIMKPSKKVNPNVKVIIKYPNWYDHFQGLGFDLKNGPHLFDGVWTGTETRDPGGDQHLQNYLSYNIIRYFENLRPGHNFGGWVDSGGSHMGMDRYAEQLWLTMFSKTPEMILFAYNQLLGVSIRPQHRTPWQGQGTSFDFDEMMKPIQLANGQTVKPTTLARAAGITFEQIDKFVYKLGNPIGIKSYKPYHSLGDDFLQNYLGMIGLPMDMYSEFPTDQKVVLLTEQAKYDEQIISKIKTQLQKGKDIVITSSLLKAIPDKIADIAELRCTDLKALVNDFGRYGTIDRDILIPQVRYQTNDSWEMVSAGRPLNGGVSGYPILLRAPYSQGNLFVLTIPDDMGNLYDYPEGALNVIRRILSQDLDIRIEGPSKVSLFVYDNGTFIVESFNDTPVNIKILTDENIESLTDIIDGSVLTPKEKDVNNPIRRYQPVESKNEYTLTLMPHSYRVFEKKNNTK